MYDLNNGSASVNISTSNDSILMTSSKLVNLQETTESLKESSFTTMSVKSPIHSYDTFEDPSLSASSGSLSENISDIGPDVFMLPNEHMNMSYTDFEEDLASFVAEYGNFSDTVIEEHPELPTVPDTIVKSSSLNTKPDVSVTSAISTSSSTRIFERSSNRKQHRKQTGYQDIISGLVKLLGGKNVQVANSGSVSKDPARGALSASSRINHRAPPRITFAEPNTTIPPTSTMPLSVQGTFSSSDSNSFTGTDNAPSLLGFSNDHSLDPSEPLVVITSISSTVTVQTTRTDRPTGPITEWLPANGKHPVGYKPSISTTTIKNQPSVAQESSTFSAISLKSSTIKKDDSILDITKTGTKNAFSPETEVSYAGIAPSTTLPPSYKTSSKSSSSSLSSLSSSSSSSPPPSRAVLSESNTQSKEATSPLPMSNTDGIVTTSRSGVVLPVISKRQSSTRLSESVTTIVTRYHNHHPFPTRQPTGSPFVIPVDIHEIELKNDGKAEDPIIHGTKRPSSNDQSVFIHGQKTYFNLMPSETRTSGDSTLVNVGIGYSFPSNNNKRPPVGQGSVSNVELPQSKPINRPQPAKVPQIIKNTPVR